MTEVDFGDALTEAFEALRARYAADAESVPCRLSREHVDACTHSEASPCRFLGSGRCPLAAIAAASADRRRIDGERRRKDRETAERLGIPRIHWHVLGLADPGEPYPPVRQTDALVAVMGATARETLILCGPTGTGKSAAAAYWCWLHRGMFRSAPSLESGDWYGREGAAEWKRLTACKALVVDDLGVEYQSDRTAWRSRLEGLVGARYNEMLPTLITTNVAADQLAAHLRDRIVSRIRQIGRVVACAGEDIRPQLRQEVLREHE